MLQKDLWALFDWNAWTADNWVHLNEHVPASRALRERLAVLIKRLALTAEQVSALPDNYGAAVRSKTFPAQHSKGTFLPANLFSSDGPWVIFAGKAGAMVPVHTRTFGGRSVFFTLLNLPGGRAETEAFIKQIGSNGARIPDGTQVALVRRASIIDAAGRIIPTAITESIQIRVMIKVPAEMDAKVHRNLGGEMDVMELTIDRARLFSGLNGGLIEVGKNERGFNFLPGMNMSDGFEAFHDNPPPDPFKNMRHTISDCNGCHTSHSLLSLTNAGAASTRLPMPPFESYNQTIQPKMTFGWKHNQFDWGLLQGWFESLK